MVTIDSEPAVKAITDFAREKAYSSRDLGVRFNVALASMILQSGEILLAGSEFARRYDLPENDHIEYTLSCPNRKSKTLKRKWSISPKSVKSFTNSKTYFTNNCLPKASDASSKKHKSPLKFVDVHSPNGDGDDFKLSEGERILDAGAVEFYKLGNSGVLAIVSEDTYPQIAPRILDGFKKFIKLGLKRVKFFFKNECASHYFYHFRPPFFE